MKNFLTLLIMMIFLLGFTSASTTFSPQDKFNKWDVRLTGEESVLYTAQIIGNDLIINKKSIQPSITKYECSYDEKSLKEVCSDKTYTYPESILVKSSTGILSTFQTSEIKSGGYTIKLNPLENLFYKIGTQSIIIVGDSSYSSVDTNITQENGYAHINVSDNNLVLYLPFDVQDKNGITYDFSKNSNDGNVYNGTTWNSNGINNSGSYVFKIPGDFISVEGNIHSSLNSNSLSIFTWIKINDTTKVTPIYGARSGNDGFDLTYRGDLNRLYLTPRNGTGSCTSYYSVNLDDLTWYSIGATFVNATGNLSYYVNGAVTASFICGTKYINLGTYSDQIGMETGSYTQAINGSLDELMLFNRSLSVAEIGTLHSQTYNRYFNTGEMKFTGINTTSTKLNITLKDCQTNLNTNLRAKIDNENIINFTSCGIINYTTTANVNNSNLTILFESNTNRWYSPIVIGNITIDDVIINAEPPSVINNTYLKTGCNMKVNYDNLNIPTLRKWNC